MSNSTPGRCKYFVQRKKRYCKMLAKPGSELCGEHQKPQDIDMAKLDESSSSAIRILCPLDGKHTVYAHNLQKHLKICNARQKNEEVYIQKDINSGKMEGPTPSDTSSDSYQLLSSFPKEQVLDVISKVNTIYEKNVKISDKKLSFPLIEEEMRKPEYGDKTKKHLKQASAILGLLEEFEFLKERTCYIEFGAGRGQLSCWIAEATEALEKCITLLIERASPKHKRDNKLAKTSNRIQRIRADIADLVLDELEAIKDTNNIVGVTKHLCGEATDLAIRCLMSTQVNKDKVYGSVLTFCCHHRCRWTPYTGRAFFEENNLTKDDFNIMCGLSSWATCGSGYSREYRETLLNGGIQHSKESPVEAEKELDYGGLSRAQREEIGRRCKNIINWGRLKYLERNNFKCSLYHYVDKEITLENVCIVAQKRATS